MPWLQFIDMKLGLGVAENFLIPISCAAISTGSDRRRPTSLQGSLSVLFLLEYVQ